MFISSSHQQFTSCLQLAIGQSQHGPLRELKRYQLEPKKSWVMWWHVDFVGKNICRKEYSQLFLKTDIQLSVFWMSLLAFVLGGFSAPWCETAWSHPVQSHPGGSWRNNNCEGMKSGFLMDIHLCLMALRCLDWWSFSGELELFWREKKEIHGEAGST